MLKNSNFNCLHYIYSKANLMNRFDKAMVRERILRLVRLKCTGTPAQLAIRLEISERSVKRLVREMKRDGLVLRYDHDRISYIGPEE